MYSQQNNLKSLCILRIIYIIKAKAVLVMVIIDIFVKLLTVIKLLYY